MKIALQGSPQRRLSSGFGFSFIAGRTTSHTAKKFIGKLWPVANDAPAKAYLCNSTGKIVSALAKSLRLPLDTSAQMSVNVPRRRLAAARQEAKAEGPSRRRDGVETGEWHLLSF
jgi:hypothetical protein